MGNNVVNNVLFLAQTDRFASQDLHISPGAILFVLPDMLFNKNKKDGQPLTHIL